MSDWGTPPPFMALNTRPRRKALLTWLLFGGSPIGLGHATRALVLMHVLERRGAGVRVFSGGKAAEFIRTAGEQVDDIVADPMPRVVDGEMKRAALWYLRSWLANR